MTFDGMEPEKKGNQGEVQPFFMLESWYIDGKSAGFDVIRSLSDVSNLEIDASSHAWDTDKWLIQADSLENKWL